ncbi:TIR domain containing protein [Halalkaliarchaeum desulfuricum]|uniref:TIR domain containing protein n=1 Tax=Halalkaliarchaeum desulfuricum TaxID=2055893 RepID=A0A343TLG1_9EURY|nr:TIR domain-containing protein [Halalkaliarchaeum desulfuricum]AUX09933.1 TIR domain containing protein [Halalkaliarchaeum desulfuricum]
MSWLHHIDRARRTTVPVVVDKQQAGPLPPGFEAQGLTINGLWGVYERQRGIEKIQIIELPTQYRVSVSNPVAGTNQLPQPAGQSNHGGDALKGLAALGLGTLGAVAIGKALKGSQKSTVPDPKQAHRVFISHSWTYEDHYKEVKELLDDAYGFEYFDHSVSSDDPIDAQLPNHLRKKIRDQIQSTSVVLVLAGMYVAYSDWIKEEIEIANEMEKPIIGVVPAKNERAPTIVQAKATELVEADGAEILDAIERHAT